MKRYTVVITIVALALLVWTSVGSAELKIKVRDAADKRVGKVVSLAGPFVALQGPDGEYFILAVNAGRLTGNRNIFFESNDCTGTPFIDREIILPFGAVAGARDTVYLPARGEISVVATVLSRLSSSRDIEQRSFDECVHITDPIVEDGVVIDTGETDFGFPLEIEVIPATAVMDLADEFTPPFRVEITDVVPDP